MKTQSKYSRFIALAMAAMMAFSAAACDAKEQDNTQQQGQQTETQDTAQPEKEEEAKTPEEKTQVRVAALNGPTAIGMLNLMEISEKGEAANNYVFTTAGAPDEIVGKVATGEVDIAAVPTNLAATLYAKTKGQVQLAALNTLGVLYIVETGDTIHSVKDLEGKTIVATGQNATPEYALNLILKKNGLTPGENVTVEYKQEHAEVAPLLANGEASIALLPQPFVTSVLTQNENVRVALDVTEEWNKAVDGASDLTMGAVIVRKEFAENNKEALDAFLDEYKASVALATGESTLEHTAQLAEQYNIMKVAVAVKAIPECNITFIEGDEMEKIASGFLTVLFEANPQSVGGALPDEAFYYKR